MTGTTKQTAGNTDDAAAAAVAGLLVAKLIS